MTSPTPPSPVPPPSDLPSADAAPSDPPPRHPAALDADPLLEELGDLVVAVSRQLQHGAHDHEDVVPLTGTEVIVLRWVDRHPGATPSSTAAGVGLRRPNLSAALRGLVAKDMLIREADPEDSRSVRLVLTDRARSSSAAIRAHWGAELAARLGDLTADDRAALDAAARLLARADEPRG